MYLPLKDRHLFSPDILQGIEVLDLIALDDIDHISGDAAWEEAMYHFYNRHKESGGRHLVSANAAPRALAVELEDLKSRLAHGLIFHLQPLSDQDKKQALLLRAKNRGLVMPEDVAEFLLKRCTRDMNSLFLVLEQLDAASMQAKRRLSIPFVRQVLSC